ncbi:MAG TPA: hypothetical protein VEB64_04320 [Azospirillaceae bacterium]|nr:hypothetical protein [Azospirillaceae bacterium]
MNDDRLIETGALALYRSENAHRIQEFARLSNAEQVIAGDFETCRNKYVRKFQDILTNFDALGLSVVRAA